MASESIQQLTFPETTLRDLVVGVDTLAPTLDGKRRRYINLDNAATTPAFRRVVDRMTEFAGLYSSVHRGTGFKSFLSTELYERCRQTVLQFVNATDGYHTAIFGSNTTDAINGLCNRLRLGKDERVITTVMEHHSNMLPWRLVGAVEYVDIIHDDGSLDVDELRARLERGGKTRLVAVTGASNVTGMMPPLRRIARLAHEHGAYLLVDGAQLAAHRPIDMGAPEDPERIDFLAFSAHKMYAPFGSGVLVGPRRFFAEGPPHRVGGGAVDIVTLDDVEWTRAPEREEAGTPNLMGALALAEAINVLEEIGLDRVAEHERELTAATLNRLLNIDGIRIYGAKDPELTEDRVGVIPIQADGFDHALLAAILSYEYGIGVRHGCFCAHPYVVRLLDIGSVAMSGYTSQIRAGDRSYLPGFVRISLGLYNTLEEIDALADALARILSQGPTGEYHLDKSTGEYRPAGFSFDANEFTPGFLL